MMFSNIIIILTGFGSLHCVTETSANVAKKDWILSMDGLNTDQAESNKKGHYLALFWCFEVISF